MDFDFTLGKTYTTFRYRAPMASVLYPLFGARYQGGDLCQESLRNMWRMRLVTLKEAGWDVLADDDRRLQYLRNCRPFGMPAEPGSYPCHQPRVCPYCWQREYVHPAFTYLERLLFGSTAELNEDGEMKRPPEGLKVVAFRTRYRIDWNHVPADEWRWRLETSFRSDRALRYLVDAHRHVETRLHRAKAYALLYRVNFPDEPTDGKPGEGQVLYLERGGVALTLAPQTKEAQLERADKLSGSDRMRVSTYHKVYEWATKNALDSAFRAAFRYPRGMMFREAADVAAALHGLAVKPKMRLYSTKGPKGAVCHRRFIASLGLDTAYPDDD